MSEESSYEAKHNLLISTMPLLCMIYKLKPLLTYNLWGGKKLSKIFHQPTSQYGEAWIMSCLKVMNSPISKTQTLKDLFLKNKNIVKKPEFPPITVILSSIFKLIFIFYFINCFNCFRYYHASYERV